MMSGSRWILYAPVRHNHTDDTICDDNDYFCAQGASTVRGFPYSHIIDDVFCPSDECFLFGNQTIRIIGTSDEDTTIINYPKCSGFTAVDMDHRHLKLLSTHRSFKQHLFHNVNNLLVNLNPDDHNYVHVVEGEQLHELGDLVKDSRVTVVEENHCFSSFEFVNEFYSVYGYRSASPNKRRMMESRWRKWSSILRDRYCIERLNSPEVVTVVRDEQGNGRPTINCSFGKEVLFSKDNKDDIMVALCNTKTLISADGNSLTNMIFMKQGSQIVDLIPSTLPEGIFTLLYGSMGSLLGHNILGLHKQSSRGEIVCDETVSDIINGFLKDSE